MLECAVGIFRQDEASPFEDAERVIGDPAFRNDVIGLPLMMNARRVDGILHGAAVASATFMSKVSTFRISCSTTVMIVEPPGLPVMRKGVPSLSTIVGAMEDRGRFLGSMALATSPTRP